MKTAMYDDPTAVLIARRAALAAQDAREREARLAEARQQEEARFVEVDRIAAAFGRFLRRTLDRPQPVPTLLRRRHDERDQEPSQQHCDAA